MGVKDNGDRVRGRDTPEAGGQESKFEQSEGVIPGSLD